MLDFQLEAVDALEEETPNSSKLERLMEFGVTLDVDLPEIPRLKQVGRHIGRNKCVCMRAYVCAYECVCVCVSDTRRHNVQLEA